MFIFQKKKNIILNQLNKHLYIKMTDFDEEVISLLQENNIKRLKKNFKVYKAQENLAWHIVRAAILIDEGKLLEAEEELSLSLQSLVKVKNSHKRNELFSLTETLKAEIKIQKNQTKEAIRDLEAVEIQCKSNEIIKKKIETIKKTLIKPVSASNIQEKNRFVELYRENIEIHEDSKWFLISAKWFIS